MHTCMHQEKVSVTFSWSDITQGDCTRDSVQFCCPLGRLLRPSTCSLILYVLFRCFSPPSVTKSPRRGILKNIVISYETKLKSVTMRYIEAKPTTAAFPLYPQPVTCLFPVCLQGKGLVNMTCHSCIGQVLCHL
jgi:hypothetical protein